MKKILLLAAVASLAVSAQADTFGEIFKISKCVEKEVNDETVYEAGQQFTNGQTVVWSYYEVDLPGTKYEDTKSSFPILATNISDEPWRLDYEIKRVAPSFEDLPTSEELGSYQGCFTFLQNFKGNCIGGGDGDTTDTTIFSSEEYPEVNPGQALKVDMDISGFKDMTPRTFQIKFFVTEMGEVYKDAIFNLYVKFTNENDIANAVEGIEVENAAPVYYNLQGARVANPEKGIFIKVQGNKATKVVL